jgi:GNAT superfamily N-acetyltransferase
VSEGDAANTEPPRVRFASPDDVELVARENYIANVGGLARVRRLVERRHVVVAEWAGQPVGYAYFDYLGVLDPFLAMIWVAEPRRGRGVGAALLRFLEAHFRGRGHAVLYSSARVDQPRPQAWHRRMGFEECGFIAGLGPGDVGQVLFRKRLGRDEA